MSSSFSTSSGPSANGGSSRMRVVMEGNVEGSSGSNNSNNNHEVSFPSSEMVVAVDDNKRSLRGRLRSIQRSVQKATKEALRQATATDPLASLSSSKSKGSSENDDPNASFYLGMELFGQEVSVIEKNIQDRLYKIERDLEDVIEKGVAVSDEPGSLQQSGRDISESVLGTMMGDDVEADGNDEANIHQTPEELEQQAEHLRTKIRFLRECSKARSLLDESITISSPSLCPNGEPDNVRAAKLVVQAEQSLSRAKKIVQTEREIDSNSPLILPALTIMDSTQRPLRRHKVDLLGRAKSFWNASVSLTSAPSALSVRVQSPPASSASSSSSCSPGEGGLLAVAYDMLEVFADSGNSALDDILRKFTKSMYEDVIRAALESHASDKARTAEPWCFHESEERGTTSTCLPAKVIGAPPALLKGVIRRLEWNHGDDDDEDEGGVARHESVDEDKARPGQGKDNGRLSAESYIAQIASWKETMSFIQRLVVFVTDNVLLSRPRLCKWVGKMWFGKPGALPSALNLNALGLNSCRVGDDNGLIMEPLIDVLEETCLPEYIAPNELVQLRSMADEVRRVIDPFVAVIKAKKLYDEGEREESRLAKFVAEFQNKYVENRRCGRLNEARRLLMENDYHNTVEVGVDVPRGDGENLGLDDGMAVFQLHKCCVSDTAHKLMLLYRRTMDEAVEEGRAATDEKNTALALLPTTLYRTAREMLDLFRAIIPVTHGHEVATVPRTAAVLHNDCVFFAHHCLTLGLEYKEKFALPSPDDARGKLLHQHCIFVDMVPLFRELADQSMRSMLERQANQVAELVAPRISILNQALRSDEIVVEWSEAETALNAAVYHLRHLSQTWKPVLSADIFSRCMCYLADVVFSRFLDQVGKAATITPSASHFAAALFQKASDEIGNLVGVDRSGSRLWDRFNAIGRFMDMSIPDIQVALSDGVFRSVTGAELSRLIKATFEDTPKRKRLLDLLASH